MKNHRKNIRLRNWDYTNNGFYFVTICTQNQYHYFKNYDVNTMITKTWHDLKQKYPDIILDQFIVMPNHIHGIIGIVGADLCVRPKHNGSTHRSTPTLGEIIRWFKTMTTNYYIHGVNQFEWVPFVEKLWQRNYYDHIIRDEQSLRAIRKYIDENSKQWHLDKN